jgi:hypothetical protein
MLRRQAAKRKCPLNVTENTCLDRPTRLADGLGLESTLVRCLTNLRPVKRRF